MKAFLLVMLVVTATDLNLFSQETTDQSVATILALPHDSRGKQINKLVEDNFKKTNPSAMAAVREELQKSLAASYSPDNRDTVTEIIGRFRDTKAIPILLAHLTQRYSSIGISFSAFRMEYPYASALTYYGNIAIKPIIEAVSNSNDPQFEKVAFRTIVSMGSDAAYPLLDSYKKVGPDTKMAKFIVRCFHAIAPNPQGNWYLDAEISNEKDSAIRGNLQRLKSELNK